MTKVTFKGVVLAESNDTIIVEGNHYFPPSSVNKAVLTDSDTQYVRPSALLVHESDKSHANSLKHNMSLERVRHLSPLIPGVSGH